MAFQFLFPKKHLFIAGMPKSGTTFLVQSIMQAAVYGENYPPTNTNKIVPIDFFNLTKHFSEAEYSTVKNKNTVGKMHLVGDKEDIQFLNKHNFFTVFIYRNIFDVIESMKRHFDGLDKDIVIPDYHQLSDSNKFDGVIDYFVPNLLKMYLNFTNGQLKRIVVLNYNQLLSNPYQEMHHIFSWAKFPFEDATLQKSVKKKYGTYRGGESGKGKVLLSEQQISNVYEKVSLYKDQYNFSPFLNE